MMTFLLSAGAMIIVLLLIICIPLLTFRKKDTGAEELPQANIAIYRDQFKELEDELARGAISQNEYDESRLELERRDADKINGVVFKFSNHARWAEIVLLTNDFPVGLLPIRQPAQDKFLRPRSLMFIKQQLNSPDMLYFVKHKSY